MVGNETYHISPLNHTRESSGRRRHRIRRGLNDSLSKWICGESSSELSSYEIGRCSGIYIRHLIFKFDCIFSFIRLNFIF